MSVLAPSLTGTAPSAAVPLLVDGDRLNRYEFHRRYLAMSENFRAELIEGVVVKGSRAPFRGHAEEHAKLQHWIGIYDLHTDGVLGGCHCSVILDHLNEPQPDICLLIDPARGGSAKIDAEGYIEGAPELLVEIAGSTVKQDLGPKFAAYQRNGVREYIVWRVSDSAVDWFALHDGRFDRLEAGADGVTRSEVFPGLWLDIPALLAGDMARVHAVLWEGLADPAHAVFTARLSEDSARTP